MIDIAKSRLLTTLSFLWSYALPQDYLQGLLGGSQNILALSCLDQVQYQLISLCGAQESGQGPHSAQ